MSNQPAATFRIGYVKATIWANDVNGTTFFNTTLSRTIKEDGEYRDVSNLGHADLVVAIRVLQRAEAFISSQQ